MSFARRFTTALVALAAALIAQGCATWKPVQETSSWTLYVKDGERVDATHFGQALGPAFQAVEARMGSFEEPVRVHAWDGDAEVRGGRGGLVEGGEPGEMEEVPGIGPARVRAFHVRGGAHPFSSSGVFLGVADVGTAVHELVHARLSEIDRSVPLWFEEGLASYYGDGAAVDGDWVVDGLACWPLRELREQELDDGELELLLAIDAGDDYDARENLLVHFLGWAIVFDLSREHPEADWKEWLAAFRKGARQWGEVSEARRRVDRTLAERTHVEWLEVRLTDDDPRVRMAVAKGVWKLHSRSAVDALLDRLEVEQDPTVAFGLALNCMLTTGEMRLGRERWWRLRRLVFPVLKNSGLPSDEEREASEELYSALRRWDSKRRADVQGAVESLSRFWEE